MEKDELAVVVASFLGVVVVVVMVLVLLVVVFVFVFCWTVLNNFC
jgi:uncharacterized membrane protein